QLGAQGAAWRHPPGRRPGRLVQSTATAPALGAHPQGDTVMSTNAARARIHGARISAADAHQAAADALGAVARALDAGNLDAGSLGLSAAARAAQAAAADAAHALTAAQGAAVHLSGKPGA